MELFHRAIVALENSPNDAGLLNYAAMIAGTAAAPAEIGFVHVIPSPGMIASGAPAPAHAEALKSLQAAVANIRTRSEVSCHVLTGPRLDKLLEFAAEWRSDVVLVGHGRRHTGRRSLARRLAMKGTCSLWMVPRDSASRISNLVAAVDFSSPSARSLSIATLLASRLGIAGCTAVYVHSPNALSPDDAVQRIVQEMGEQAFRRFIDPLDLHGVTVRLRIEESGSVPGAILRAATEQQADLIVMGSRGLSHSSAVLLGSESEHMLIETDRPVLITRNSGERLGLLEVLLDRNLQPKEPLRFG